METLATFLTSAGTVITAATGWATDFGTMIVSTPALFVPFVMGLSFTGIAIFKSLRG